MAEPLIIVDVQRCFLNQYTHHIPARVAELVRRGGYDPLLFTRFVNTPGSPYRRFLDWHECDQEPHTTLAPEVAGLAERGRVFVKEGYMGLPDDLVEYLDRHSIGRVTIVGIDTDMCVLKVALDVFDLGIEPVVLVDCCASTAGLQAHLAGLAILSRNIGPHQLHDAGLGGGHFAAPE
ncbi:MAG: cysteine hydrolase family protein [Chloroflexota bacterium]